MADKFEDLRTYLTVLDAGGINAAADELGIAKSAVSRRLSDLEKRLGTTLIGRATRRFEPTAVGIAYARGARAVLTSLDELDASVRAEDDRPPLSVRCADTAIAFKLLAGIGSLDGRAPETVRIIGDDRTPLTDHEFSAGPMRVGAGPDGHRLFAYSTVLCGSPSYLARVGTPKKPSDLDALAAIVVSGDAAGGWGADPRARRLANVVVEAPDAATAAAAAAAGLGIAVLPDFMVADAISGGALVRVLPEQEAAPTQVFAWFNETAGQDVWKVVDGLAAALG